MISLMPDELFAATCQLVCYGCAMVSALAACLWWPRW